MAHSQEYDVIVIGGGIAGLTVALRLPERLRVALLTKGQLGESNTRYAQGGMAVALGVDDSPELHLEDTLVAGAGLCDEVAVRALVEEAPAAVRWLIQEGVQFDRATTDDEVHQTEDGLLLGREAAHSRWRILHAGGDATGAEIERALVAQLRTRTTLDLYEESQVVELLVKDGTCRGLRAIDRAGQRYTLTAGATVLASGGAGGLWLHTSNPSGATADGLALAWQAGAALTDLEFMQFHPTVLGITGASHLISEAVRGEGAYLRNHAGERFMPRYHEQAELAPRDVVARAILSEMLLEQADCQYLDLRHLPDERMYARFPTISELCRQSGLDLAHDLLPIAPAAHYCMGGVRVDTRGRTSLPGLYAVGEVACTGVHGANRLASNSLLEGLVFGLRVAAELGSEERSVAEVDPNRRDLTLMVSGEASQESALFDDTSSEATTQQIVHDLRHLMWEHVSLIRDREGLTEAQRRINDLRRSLGAHQRNLSELELVAPQWIEALNMLSVAELVIMAAQQRLESRGSHWRSDHSALDPEQNGLHYVFRRQRARLHEGAMADILQEAMPYA